MSNKIFVLIGEPNGSGKTTYITELMKHYAMGEFINADNMTKAIVSSESLKQDEANHKAQKLARAHIQAALIVKKSPVIQILMDKIPVFNRVITLTN